MTTYESFLTKKHDVRIVKDFKDLVYKSAEQFPQLPAFVLHERTISYSDFLNEYKGLCTKFFELGYEGKRIAVTGENSYEWILTYLAAATVGVVVPIDKELATDDIRNFLNDSLASAVVADAKILKALDSSIDIDKYILCDKKGLLKDSVFKSSLELSIEGIALYEAGNKKIDSHEIDTEKMTILIFTSGTTGNSKGVCLSQKNICTNIVQIANMVKVDPSRHSLSILPLHHTYESTIGHLLLLSYGGCVSYLDSLRYITKNIEEFQPSVIIVVPLLLEYMLGKIEKTVRSSLPKFLLPKDECTFETLMKRLPFFVRKAVQKKVRASLGGKLSLMIVGAAPLKPEIVRGFEMLGIKTYQGYGLTETSPLLAGNNDFYVNPDSVGLPIRGVEIKIDNPNDEGVGEILAKGDNIMLGYYNDEEATAKVMQDGYFHTGDLGKLDENGWLYITGRCKNVIVTKNGKNIYPEELETRLCDEELIEEAVVIGVPDGDNDMIVKAKIFPCYDIFKENNGGTLPSNEDIEKKVREIVTSINKKLPGYKRITEVELVWEAFEKTTTKKIKRYGQNVQ